MPWTVRFDVALNCWDRGFSSAEGWATAIHTAIANTGIPARVVAALGLIQFGVLSHQQLPLRQLRRALEKSSVSRMLWRAYWMMAIRLFSEITLRVSTTTTLRA